MSRVLSTQIQDVTAVSSYTETPEGYIVFKDVKVSRIGVQKYYGYELGLDVDDVDYDRQLSVYRPPESVFEQQSMDSFANKPVTDGHPWDLLNSSNVAEYQKGVIGSVITKTDSHVIADKVVIMDSGLAADYKMGVKKEVSMGYTVDWEVSQGVTPKGEAYDLIQKNIRGNHLAVVERGRCGTSCNLGDSAKNRNQMKGSDMSTVNYVNVSIDGLDHQVTPTGKQIIDKVLADKKASDAKYDALKQASLDAESKLKGEYDAKLQAKDEEIKTLKDAQLTPEGLDSLIAKRQDTITVAQHVLGDEYVTAGVGCDQLKKAVVASKLGDEAVAGKDSNYIDPAYEVIAKEARDSMADEGASDDDNFLTNSQKTPVGDAGKPNTKSARDEYLEKTANAHVIETKKVN